MHAEFTLILFFRNLTQAWKKVTKNVQYQNLISERPHIFMLKKKIKMSERNVQLPEVFVKTKNVHAKFGTEGDFQSWNTRIGKKTKFIYWRTWWGVWKTDSRCLPAISFLISWLKGKQSYEKDWWRTHFFSSSFLFFMFLSSSLHWDQTLSNTNLFLKNAPLPEEETVHRYWINWLQKIKKVTDFFPLQLMFQYVMLELFFQNISPQWSFLAYLKGISCSGVSVSF